MACSGLCTTFLSTTDLQFLILRMEFVNWQAAHAAPNTVSIGVCLVGSHRRNDMMKLFFRMPFNTNSIVSEEQKTRFLEWTVNTVHREIKFSGAWNCMDCDQPARELVHTSLTFLEDMQGPYISDFVHAICRQGSPCHEKHQAEMESGELAVMRGLVWQTRAFKLDDERSAEALAASCAFCHAEGKMSVCSGCKVIRYCGRKCQTEDFSRHKKVCKWILEVKKENVPKLSHG